MTTPTKRHAALTICALNYLGRALVLRNSFLELHPESDFYIVLVDRKDARVEAEHAGVGIIWAEDLGIARFFHAALKFDVIELSTNVKPTALKLLLARYETVLYIDPDIRVFAHLTPVFEALASHAIVVTPHSLTPLLDGHSPSDEDFSRFGSFNLGFIGVSKTDEAFAFLDWWSERCLKLGFYEPQIGLAVDQKWVDLAPCYFPSLQILRDVGLNVAFWNLHERKLSRREGTWFVNEDAPLYFFHFSSFSADDPHAIAHKQSRFPPGSRPDVHPLVDEYAALLKDAGHHAYADRPYGFDYFDDGSYVTPTLRRVFATLEPQFPANDNPFVAGSTVHRFALKRRLALRNHRPARRVTFKDMGRFSAASRTIGHGLTMLLRVLGPERYFLLMKYLAHISSIRNQKDLVKVEP